MGTRRINPPILEGVTHGLASTYSNGCGCDACLAGWMRAQKRRIRLKQMGVEFRIPADRARKLMLKQMRDNGLSLMEFSRATGIGPSSLRRLKNGGLNFVKLETFRAMQTMPHYTPAISPRVPVRATAIRLEIIQSLGHTREQMNVRIGRMPNLAAKRAYKEGVFLSSARRVIEALEYAIANPRPDSLTAIRAKGARLEQYDRDLLLDLYWDGEGGLVDNKPMRGEELLNEIDQLVDLGVPLEQALQRFGKEMEWYTLTRKRIDARRIA